MYQPPWQWKPPRRPDPPRRVPAPITMLEREFENRELGIAGELLVASPPEPAPPVPEWRPPPPPWAEALARGEVDLAALNPPEPPPERMPALLALKLELGDEPYDPPPPGPIVVDQPLEPYDIPPVSTDEWRLLEREAIQQNRQAELERARKLLDEHEPAKSLQPRPARKGSATPNLDKVREWMRDR